MIELVIHSRRRDLGGFEVGRVLPWNKRRMVGPFIFFDHMGPVVFPPNLPKTTDVRPHPHIGLSTITYLFTGEIMHRDSVGSEQPIRPGEVNWMTAGRGITHSERFERARQNATSLLGSRTPFSTSCVRDPSARTISTLLSSSELLPSGIGVRRT
jgi:redox-sensitive bicupin YhaK (pirin superfamily)